MLEPPLLRELQAQVVETGRRIVGRHPGHSLFQGRCPQQQQAAELEIIPQGSLLVVDDRCRHHFPTLGDETVRVQQGRAGVIRHLQHPFQGVMDQGQVRPAGVEKGEFRRCSPRGFA